jgi:phosphohistidine phosphatase
MKTLYIVRHAKAESKDLPKKDFDRSLTKKGMEDARLMGEALRDSGLKPAFRVISSPAARALETAQIMVETLDMSVENIICNKEIYDASLKTMLKVIGELPDKMSSVMLFGHNTSFLELVNYLGNKVFAKFPKGAVVGIQFPYDKWKEINKKSGRVIYYEYPKNVRQLIQ